MVRPLDEERAAGGLLLLGERLGGGPAHLGVGIFQGAHEAFHDLRAVMLVERLCGGGAHARLVVAEPLEQQHLGLGPDGLGELHHRDAAHARIGIGAALGQIVEIVVEGVEDRHRAHRSR